jgi:hypothetical protein
MGICLRKPDTRFAQPVDIRGIQITGPVASGIKRALVIRKEEDDIRFLLISPVNA